MKLSTVGFCFLCILFLCFDESTIADVTTTSRALSKQPLVPSHKSHEVEMKAECNEQNSLAVHKSHFIDTDNYPSGVKIILLDGSYQQMGYKYGNQLQNELRTSLKILKKFYITEHHISLNQLYEKAELFYKRFPKDYQVFIQSMARGAHISSEDAKLLNAMETLGSLLTKSNSFGPQCAFMALPSSHTASMSHLIGRNYDFSRPYDELARYLTITIIKAPNLIPTATIALAGEIYCPTCINAKGIFLELNNGMPSGGYVVNEKPQSLLIRLLTVLQSSHNLNEVRDAFRVFADDVDYSLIVNVADQKRVDSYEFSSTKGMKEVNPSAKAVFVSTNYYLNTSWDMAHPTDQTTWLGVTRRNNLIHLGKSTIHANLDDFEALMDKNLKQGGAVWPSTIYQIIYDPLRMTVYLKVNARGRCWYKVVLSEYFKKTTKYSSVIKPIHSKTYFQ